MSPLFSIPLIAATAVVGVVTVIRVTAWSFSTARRHRLAAKAHARTMARHRAERRTA